MTSIAGTTYYDEDLGFPGVCAAPCFSVDEDYEVWGPNDPGNPLPEPGYNTYVYRLTHEGGSGPFLPEVMEFELAVDTTSVLDAGWTTEPGVEPSSVTIDEQRGVVSWEFHIDLLGPGETTTELFIQSSLYPGYTSTSIGSQAALTAVGDTMGPTVVPEPSTSILMLTALVTLAVLSRFKRRTFDTPDCHRGN